MMIGYSGERGIERFDSTSEPASDDDIGGDPVGDEVVLLLHPVDNHEESTELTETRVG